MSPTVVMPAGHAAVRAAALRELHEGLEAAQCAAALLAKHEHAPPGQQLLSALLGGISRARAAVAVLEAAPTASGPEATRPVPAQDALR